MPDLQQLRAQLGGQVHNPDPSALRDHINVLKALGLRNQQIAQHPLVATHPLIAHHLADRFDRQARGTTSRTYGQGQAPLREPTQPGPPRVLPHMPGYTPTPGPRPLPLPPPTGVAPMAPRPGAYRPTPGPRSQPPATASWLRPRFTGY